MAIKVSMKLVVACTTTMYALVTGVVCDVWVMFMDDIGLKAGVMGAMNGLKAVHGMKDVYIESEVQINDPSGRLHPRWADIVVFTPSSLVVIELKYTSPHYVEISRGYKDMKRQQGQKDAEVARDNAHKRAMIVASLPVVNLYKTTLHLYEGTTNVAEHIKATQDKANEHYAQRLVNCRLPVYLVVLVAIGPRLLIDAPGTHSSIGSISVGF
jgi:hypothetical protein